MDELLHKVKLALRLSESDFDSELTDLINAGLKDLGLAGVFNVEESDSLIIRAIITYCKMSFGQPDDYDRLKDAYDEQKAQLSMATNYTRWD